jgi:hypothetical protein
LTALQAAAKLSKGEGQRSLRASNKKLAFKEFNIANNFKLIMDKISKGLELSLVI